MKSTIRLITTISALLLVSVAGAFAADWTTNLYVTADLGGIYQQNANLVQNGVNTQTAAFNPGVRTDLAVGYHINNSCAVELEPGFMWNSVFTLNGNALSSSQSIDFYSIPFLANFVYRFPNDTALTPYIGVGVGGNVGMLEGKLTSAQSFNGNDLTFAYQGEVGFKYALTQNASLGLAYKFLGTTDQSYNLTMAPNYIDHATFQGVYIHGLYLSFTWSF